MDEDSELEMQKLKDFCVVLDLCEESDDLLQASREVSGEGVVGFYALEEESLTLILDGETPGLRSWLNYAHEYAHALQDQQFDLSKVKPQEEDFDSWKAVKALVEGDAKLVEYLFYESLPVEQQTELATSTVKAAQEFVESPQVVEAPRIVSETFSWEYSAGLDFVFRIYLAGGWSAIDTVYERLPESTEQILYPEKYLSDEAPHDVSLPDLSATLGVGWQERDVGVLGELMTGIYLGTFLTEDQAESAAEGWGGDRYVLLKADQGGRLMVMRFSWDTAEDAEEFFQAYLDLVDEKSAGQWELIEKGPNKRWWVGEDTSVYLALQGDNAQLIIAPDQATIEAILPTMLATSSE